jgi:predicted Zn-dependent protease
MKKLSHLLLMSLFILSACASKSGGEGGGGLGEPSDEEINAEAFKAYQEIKSKSKISTNKRWTAIVERVSQKIAAASGEPFQWEVVLLENPEPNAWCMPGGKMAVYTGILPILETEGALAAVMGHEVAHATKRHGKQRYARAMRGNLAGLIIGGAAIVGGQLLCKTQQCRLLTALGGATAGLAVAFFDRKFSRADETEADHEGQIYMAKAGYEPSEAVRVWERMEKKAGGGKMPEFMSTHPANDRRRNNLQSWLPAAEQHYSQSPQKLGTGERL